MGLCHNSEEFDGFVFGQTQLSSLIAAASGALLWNIKSVSTAGKFPLQEYVGRHDLQQGSLSAVPMQWQ